MLLAIPFGVAGLIIPSNGASLGLMFVASVFLTSCLGPCNTVTANVVPANQRAVGYALSIFLLHLFGDIPSPPLIGSIADWLGRPEVRGSVIGRFFEGLGAVPVHAANGQGLTNLTAGMLLIVPVLALGSLAFWWGSRHLVRDEARAKALSGVDFDDPPSFH